MKTTLQKFCCLLFLITFCVSCSKDDSSSDGFYYYENGIGKKYKADYAYYNPGFGEISAFKSDEEILYFELTSFAVGTYNIDNNINYFYYYGTNSTTGTSFTGRSGTVTIAKITNGKFSGTFNVTGTGTGALSTLTSVKGNFQNLITLP